MNAICSVCTDPTTSMHPAGQLARVRRMAKELTESEVGNTLVEAQLWYIIRSRGLAWYEFPEWMP